MLFKTLPIISHVIGQYYTAYPKSSYLSNLCIYLERGIPKKCCSEITPDSATQEFFIKVHKDYIGCWRIKSVLPLQSKCLNLCNITPTLPVHFFRLANYISSRTFYKMYLPVDCIDCYCILNFIFFHFCHAHFSLFFYLFFADVGDSQEVL